MCRLGLLVAQSSSGRFVVIIVIADLQDRISSIKRRLTEVCNEAERQRSDLIDEADVAKALDHYRVSGFRCSWRSARGGFSYGTLCLAVASVSGRSSVLL